MHEAHEHPHRVISVRTAITIGIFVLITGVVAGFYTAAFTSWGQQRIALRNSADEPQGVDFSPVWKAWNILNDNFVPAAVSSSTPIATTTATLNQQKVYGMVSGLADSLNDPYTFFFPPTENAQFSDDMSGTFEGVGMEIDVKNGILTVTSPLKDTPSYKAGIKTGDEILKINGKSTQGLDVNSAIKKIRGPKNTTVTFTIIREGWDAPRDISVVRDTINIPIVKTTARKDGVFVISIATFTSNSPDLFRGALREFVQSGDSKLVLDLRGNPGGYLEAAVNIGSWFLPSGDVIVTEDYAGHAQSVPHRSLGYNIFTKNLKMVILVDKGSASASEILADSLRYYGVGKMVGTNTFGKGVVQQLFPITSDTSLKVTVARWLGPDGTQIPHDGLVPDVVATTSEALFDAGKDPQLDTAVRILNAQ